MKTKQQRLSEVYTYLRDNGKVHTQNDFAKVLRITRPAISAAINGNEAYLTKNLFQKICAAFPGVFNLEYLLNGEGSLLADGHTEPSEPEPIGTSSPAPASVDADFYHKALELNAKVISDLRDDINYYKQMVLDKDDSIQENAAEIISLQSRLAAATNELERVKATLKAVRENFDTKQTEIDRCNQIISTLQRQLDSTQINSPFPLGTAEPGGIKSSLLATDE